jgi:hypothetical protein
VHFSPKGRLPPKDPAINAAHLAVFRIAPLAIMNGTVRNGTHQGRLRRPCGISDP